MPAVRNDGELYKGGPMVTVDVESEPIVGWTNIARNLGVAESTARKWEKTLGVPIKRAGSLVYADEQELFDWKVKENNRQRKLREKSA